jgi:hypothetical protein
MGMSEAELNRAELHELLPLYALNQVSLEERQQLEVALHHNPDWQAELEELRQVFVGLDFAAPAVEPSHDLKSRLLERAAGGSSVKNTQGQNTQGQNTQGQNTQIRAVLPLEATPHIETQNQSKSKSKSTPWFFGSLGLAAAVSSVLIWNSSAPPALASLATDAAVVASSEGYILLGNNEKSKAPIVVVDPAGKAHPITLEMNKPMWYTEAVIWQGKGYLLCGANNKVIVVDLANDKILSMHATPAGSAGLSVVNGEVWLKGASSGEIMTLKGDVLRSKQLSSAAEMPMQDFMDAVLPSNQGVWVSHHAKGELFLLDSKTLEVRKKLELGGAPVALAAWRKQILVVDVTGYLLLLDQNGKLERRLALPGHPDKMTVGSAQNGTFAYLTDRSGMVFKVNLEGWKLEMEKKFQNPMDITALPDGHLALADGKGGLKMLDAALEPVGDG